MSGIAAESGANPTPFYVIGRSVSIAYGVGSVVATWLVGRRIIGDVGGVLAALVLPASALAVDHAQVVRTDSAGLFFALIALWLILRAMDGGRFRDWAFAAGAIGLAVSSRYFFATLVVPYGVAALLWLRAMPDSTRDATRHLRWSHRPASGGCDPAVWPRRHSCCSISGRPCTTFGKRPGSSTQGPTGYRRLETRHGIWGRRSRPTSVQGCSSWPSSASS